MKQKNKTILITGATGFIGSNILRYYALKKKYKCYITIRSGSKLDRINDCRNKTNLVNCDLTNPQILKNQLLKIKPDVIIHTATYGGFSYQSDPKKIINANINGTFNLLQTASELKNLKAFINTGSSSEYGKKPFSMKESDPLEPVTVYGVSKSAATLFASYFHKSRGLPVITLRLFSPYGYFDGADRFIPSSITALLNNKPFLIRSPRSVRDYIFIDDVVHAYSKAVNYKSKHGQIYNIGSGHQYSMKNIIKILTGIIPYSSQIEYADLPLPAHESSCWKADIKKTCLDLNWKPKTGIQNGLKKTVKWIRQKPSY